METMNAPRIAKGSGRLVYDKARRTIFSQRDGLKEALLVARVGLNEIEAHSVTDAEIKRVAIEKIDHALRVYG